ncbi:MAG: hypothetical protein E7580_01475 [Ruminococcaceae bacterium]|nr:hypothetical protein [Oscillospiraceae bacterium]
MKRILLLLLTLAMLLPLVACSSESLSEQQPAEKKTTAKEEESKAETKDPLEEEEPLPTGKPVYPDGFSVGYNRQDISPTEFPIVSYAQFDRTATSIHDPIQLTVTALCDGENVALLCSVDMRGVPDSFASYCATLVERETGISKEFFFLNATHTHSSVEHSLFGQDAAIKKWQAQFYKKLVRAAVLALHDLTPAEAYIGTANTEGITFVRRYLMSDGSYKGISSQTNGREYVSHETEADTQLRTIRFVREGKKDVLMVNYQTHYGGSFPDSISADFVHLMREQTEAELDCHFAYHSGAGANLSFSSAIPGKRLYPNIEAASPALVQTVKDAVAAESKAETGKIRAIREEYQATAKGNWKKAIPFSAITCGDLGFIAAPYEMFDTNGKEIRDASPCKMTFICTLTNGGYAYVPSALAFTHGEYEVNNCQFEEGCGEDFAREFVRLLKECKGQD